MTTFGIKVKICGITNLKDAQAACRYGADALGFVFAKSPRRIGAVKAKKIIGRLPPNVATVGVFVDEEKDKVIKIARDCRLDCLQLHGSETPAYCKDLKKYYKIIKAIRVSAKGSLKGLERYDVDAFLLDSAVKGKSGGTGRSFDWDLAAAAKKSGRPVILAGGLNTDNVKASIKKVKPYAVDAASGLESAPGKKDHALMKRFIETVRKAD